MKLKEDTIEKKIIKDLQLLSKKCKLGEYAFLKKDEIIKKCNATANEVDQAVQILEQKNRVIIIGSLYENYNIALTKKKKESTVEHATQNTFRDNYKIEVENGGIVNIIHARSITIRNDMFTKAFDAVSNQPIDNKLKEQIRECLNEIKQESIKGKQANRGKLKKALNWLGEHNYAIKAIIDIIDLVKKIYSI